jgi:hypothetical protein
MLYGYVRATHSVQKAGPLAANVTLWEWCAFTVVSAFTNCGLTLQAGSFVGFQRHGVLLFLVALCALLGNVLYPAILRWIVVGLSAISPKGSNRKIFYRYLLLHGRECYSCLFVSQQTWLLLLFQFTLFGLQICATLGLSWRDTGYRDLWSGRRVGLAAFEAIMTRHAGATALELDKLHGGTLLIQLLNMWLAPVPYVVVLRTTNALLRGNIKRTRDDEAARSREHSRQGTPRPPPLVEDEERKDGADSSPWRRRFGFGGARRRPGAPPAAPSAEERFSRRNHRRGRALSRALLSREPSMRDAGDRRSSIGGADALTKVFFCPVTGNPLSDDRPPGYVVDDDGDDDAMVDTRLLLMLKYPDAKAPLEERITLRARALFYHAGRLLRQSTRVSGAAKDAIIIFFAWVLPSSGVREAAVPPPPPPPRERERDSLLRYSSRRRRATSRARRRARIAPPSRRRSRRSRRSRSRVRPRRSSSVSSRSRPRSATWACRWGP